MSDSSMPGEVPGTAVDGAAPPPGSAGAAVPPALVVPEVAHPAMAPGAPPLPPPPPSATYTSPAGYGAFPAAPAPSPERAALPWFLGAVAVVIGVSIAGLVVVSSRGGGVLWWGGYFVAFALGRTAWSRYSRARAVSGGSMSATAIIVMVLGGVLALGAVAAFTVAYVGEKSAPPVADGVGSCWADDGDRVLAVSCGDSAAKYVAVAQVSTDSDCAADTDGAIDSSIPGKVLCLKKK